MLDAHELLCLTHTTLHDENAWDTVSHAVWSETDPGALQNALEELVVISAGLAIIAANAEGVDPLKLIDEHFETLRENIEANET